jgi:hypothetical protein
MDEQDAFFTHGIVGAPFSVLLGRRMGADGPKAQGLQLDPHDGATRLSPAWQPWALERLGEQAPGTPRRRPKPLRRWLERHALAIATLGLMALLTGVALIAHTQGWLPALMRSLPW